MTPKGWSATRLGNAFSKRAQRGCAGLPTLSVTLNDGLVSRDSIDRKMDTTLQPEEHLLVKSGDIAYNTMRMWQGASGLAQEDALVSPAYVVLKARSIIDPLFASYLFKHPRMIHLFWAYSYGLTEDRLRLYFDDFSLVPVNLPPLHEQRRIAEILSTWDRAIETVQALIANAREQKAAMTRALLSGRARLSGFTGTWVQKRLGDFVAPERSKCEPWSLGSEVRGIELEHIEARTGRIIGTALASEQASLKTPFTPNHVLYGKLRPYLRKFARPKFSGVCSTEIWALSANPAYCIPEFLNLLVQTPAFEAAVNVSAGSKMPRAEWGVVAEASVSLPSLPEQLAISGLMETVSAELENREEQLVILRQERAALMAQLLSGKRRVRILDGDAA